MTFKEYLAKRNITGYRLAKDAGVPYTTISDLLNGKTSPDNLTLANAKRIGDALGLAPEELLKFESPLMVPFRHFRNNVLHDLKRLGDIEFANKILKERQIDSYYKNGMTEYALYLLILTDYVLSLNNIEREDHKYRKLSETVLEKPLFVGGDSIHFKSVEDAEKQLGISIIPAFREHNIIEGDIHNVV